MMNVGLEDSFPKSLLRWLNCARCLMWLKQVGALKKLHPMKLTQLRLPRDLLFLGCDETKLKDLICYWNSFLLSYEPFVIREGFITFLEVNLSMINKWICCLLKTSKQLHQPKHQLKLTLLQNRSIHIYIYIWTTLINFIENLVLDFEICYSMLLKIF